MKDNNRMSALQKEVLDAFYDYELNVQMSPAAICNNLVVSYKSPNAARHRITLNIPHRLSFPYTDIAQIPVECVFWTEREESACTVYVEQQEGVRVELHHFIGKTSKLRHNQLPNRSIFTHVVDTIVKGIEQYDKEYIEVARSYEMFFTTSDVQPEPTTSHDNDIMKETIGSNHARYIEQ